MKIKKTSNESYRYLKHSIFLVLILVLYQNFYGQQTGQISNSILFQTTNVTIGTKNQFDKIEIDISGLLKTDVTSSKLVGEPDLPIVIRQFIVPLNSSQYSISMNSNLQYTYPSNYSIVPVQPEMPLDNSPAPAWVSPNSAIYSSNVAYPTNTLEIIDEQCVLGYKIVTVEIHPFSYIPSTGQLKLNTSVDFTLSYNVNSSIDERYTTISEKRDIIAKKMIANMVFNSADISTVLGGAKNTITSNSTTNIKSLPSDIGTTPDMIIITSLDYETDFHTFALSKTKKGLPTTVITTELIEANYNGVDLAEKIFYYLKDVYNNWGGVYVLLGGDINIVPTRIITDYGISTDFYFSNVFKDYEPDFNWNTNGNSIFGESMVDGKEWGPDHFVGRLPFSNSTNLTSMLTKIEEYESASVLNQSYYNNILLMTAYYDATHSLHGGNKILSSYNTLNNLGYNVHRLYDDPALGNFSIGYDETLNKTNAISNLNTGGSVFQSPFHFIYHSDHSGPTSMSVSSSIAKDILNCNDVHNLVNAPYYHIIYTKGCSPNNFVHDESISESFMRITSGAVAFLGSSTVCYYNEGTFFNKFITQIYNNSITRIIEAHYLSSSEDKEYKRKQQLLGDPSMEVWTKQPIALAVSITNSNNLTTGPNNLSLSISNIPNGETATLCLHKDNEVYYVEEITGTGSTISKSISVNPKTIGQLQISVTCHNFIPWSQLLNIVSNTGTNLYVKSTTIDDDNTGSSSGNANNIIEPGEIIELDIELENSGLLASGMLNVTLSPVNTSNISFTLGNLTYASISSNQSATNNTSFVANISSSASNNEVLEIDVIITDALSNTYSDVIYLQVKTSIIELSSMSFTTSNGDIVIDPSETVSLTFDITNSGQGVANNITGQISSISPHIETLNSGFQSFGNLVSGANTSNTSPFTFTTNSSYTSQTIELILTLTDANNNQSIFNINLDILPAVINLDYTSNSEEIVLIWKRLALSNLFGYNIYRSNSSNGTLTKLNSQPVKKFTGYTDMGLPGNTTYYYKVSAVSNSGLEGPLSNELEAYTTLPYHSDFPNLKINESTFGGKSVGSPMTADIDNDGTKEILFCLSDYSGNQGGVFCFNHDNTEPFEIDNNVTEYGGFYEYNKAGSYGTPCIFDLDNDGYLDILTVTKNQVTGDDKRKLIVHKSFDATNDGKPDIQFSIDIGAENIRGAVISDIDNNGTYEIISKASWGSPLYIFNNLGNNYSTAWPKYFSGSATGESMPVAADLDDDGTKEIIIGFNNSLNFNAGIYVFNHDGSAFLSSNSSGLFFEFENPNGGIYDIMDSPVSIVDVDKDGYLDIVCVSGRYNSSGSEARVFVLDKDGICLTNWEYDDHIIGIKPVSDELLNLPVTSVGDVDGDGYIEIAIADNNYINLWKTNGSTYNTNFPIYVPNLNCNNIAPLLADVDADSDIEIIVASRNTEAAIHAYDLDGSKLIGWPLKVAGLVSTPCIDDIDNDGLNEIIALGGKNVHVWDCEGDDDKIEWGKFRYDQHNSGVYQNNTCKQVSGTKTVSGTEVWSGKNMYQDVVVANGGNLTITGRIQMSSGRSIKVETGGVLVIDGGSVTISDQCPGEIWQGILVEGNPSIPQFPSSNQGSVYIKNGTIENALTAITTLSSGGKLVGGGIVKLNGAIIRNNVNGVKLNPYKNYTASGYLRADRSYIVYTTFEITDDISNKSYEPNTFITLKGVDGLNINYCTFKNTFDSDMIKQDHGYGISSYNSKFYLINSSFENLNRCVYASASLSMIPVKINNNTFTNNANAVYLNVITQALLVGNTINHSNTPHYGMYLDNCTDYTIENNSFIAPLNSMMSIAGMVINNSGNDANQVYNNTFTNMPVGLLAQHDNYGNSVIEGLQIKCNEFSNAMQDIAVTENSTYTGTTGIGIYQGAAISNATLAGNTFSHKGASIYFGNNPYSDFNNSKGTVISKYFHHDGTINTAWVPKYYTDGNPNDGTPLPLSPIFPFEKKYWYYTKSKSCPDRQTLNISTPISALYTAYTTTKVNKKSSKLILDIWQDGGNEELPEEVALAYPWETYMYYNELMLASPYLSNETMIEAINNVDLLPLNLLKLILMANSQCSRSDEVLNALYDRNPLMPDTDIEDILNMRNDDSPIDDLRANVAHYANELNHYSALIKYYYLTDTIDDNSRDSLVEFTRRQENVNSHYQLVFFHIGENNLSGAEEVLLNIPTNFEFTEEEYEAHQLYTSYFNLMKTIINEEIVYEYLSTEQLNTLTSIASGELYQASALARSYIQQNNGDVDYLEPVIFPTIVALRMAKQNPLGDEDKENTVTLYPNPATTYTSINFDLESSNNYIVIKGISGKEIYSKELNKSKGTEVINVNTYASGNYVLFFYSDGQIIESIKFNISN